MRREYYRDADDYYLYGPEAITAMKGVIDECLSKEQFHSLHREIWFIGKDIGYSQDFYKTIEIVIYMKLWRKYLIVLIKKQMNGIEC